MSESPHTVIVELPNDTTLAPYSNFSLSVTVNGRRIGKCRGLCSCARVSVHILEREGEKPTLRLTGDRRDIEYELEKLELNGLLATIVPDFATGAAFAANLAANLDKIDQQAPKPKLQREPAKKVQEPEFVEVAATAVARSR